jgi:diaminopimelate decarboxylase
MNTYRKSNELYVEGCRLADIAEAHSTPLYVMSRRAILDGVRDLEAPFKEKAIPLCIYFSAKTNPVPGFLSIIKDMGIGLEIVSDYELWLARKLGFKKILVNGASKSKALLEQSFASDVDLYVIESDPELSEVLDYCRGAPEGRTLPVAVRICPNLARWNPTTGSGSKGSPYGFGLGDLDAALRMIREEPKLLFRGFQAHIGTGIKSIKPYRRTIAILKSAVLKAKELGLSPDFIDMGGGMGSTFSPLKSVFALISMFIFNRHPKMKTRKQDQLVLLARELERFIFDLEKVGVTLKKIIFEPGRVLSASCFLILLTVKRLIRKNGTDFAFCDIGSMSLTPLLLVEHHGVMPLENAPDSRRKVYDLFGDMPSLLDKIASRVELPELQVGDRLALLDTGAYVVSFTNNFRGPRPGIAMIDNDSFQLIRRAETFDDVVHYDG